MLAAQRQQAIVDRLQAEGVVRVTDLVHAFDVSDMTVRRDLDSLARRGLLIKVHGGATLRASPTSEEPGFAAKGAREAAEKAAIAAAAVALIEPGMAIALNSGTTTHALAHLLAPIPDLTVVTNSPRVAEVLWGFDTAATGHGGPVVIATGGVRTPSDALVGPLAVQALRTLNVDVCFMGVHGISLERGITTPNMLEAQTNQQMLESASRLCVLADHTKFGLSGLSRIAGLEEVQTLITDEAMSASAVDLLRGYIDDVVLAPLDRTARGVGS